MPTLVQTVRARTAAGTLNFEKVATDTGTYWRSPATRAALLAATRRTDGWLKQADLGGDVEGSFEQAFGSLAYTYLKDKAPQLLNDVVGFQLVDRNDDNTKALGLFGIHMGEQWLYAPVFFLNGELKGHELLYLKTKDTFIPLKEAWINYITGKKPHILGEGSKQDAYQLGGLAPDISRLSHMPGMGKSGCDSWAKPFLPLYACLATWDDRVFAKHAGLDKALDLRQHVGDNVYMAGALLKAASTYPEIKRSLDRFYGPNFLQETGEALSKKFLTKAASLFRDAPPPTRKSGRGLSLFADPDEKRAAELVEGHKKLEVYEDAAATVNIPEIDDAERTKLLNDGILLKDKRDSSEVSTVYNTQVRQTLTNPVETGVYEVLEKPTTFSKMLIVNHPHSQSGRENFATVVRLEDEKAWMNAHSTRLWARDPETITDYRKWFDGLPENKTLSAGTTYLAVSASGDGTVPFKVREVLGEGAYKVDFDDCCQHDHRPPNSSLRAPAEFYHSAYGAILRVNARAGSKLRSLQGELYVPAVFKFLTLKTADKPKKDDGSTVPYGYDGPACAGSDPRPIQPGNIDDIQILFSEKTAALRIYADGPDYTVDSGLGMHRSTYNKALVHLAQAHGMREKVARDLLAQAAKDRKADFRIKYADGYGYGYGSGGVGSDGYGGGTYSGGYLQPGPTAPQFPSPYTGTEFNGPNAVASIYPQEEFLPVPSLDSSRTDPRTYDIWQNYKFDQKTMRTAEQAGASGRKEVFDSSMLSGMLKAVRQDTLVDRYLGDLMRAVDKLGRILFMFYWHNEEFAERYGKQDLPELEDSLRNAFEVLGDVLLFLREKTVNPLFDGLSEPDISEAARN